jgi:FMN phosphatase YigB (HAD superfamily)
MTEVEGTRADWIGAWLASHEHLRNDPVLWGDIGRVCDVMAQVDGLCHDLYKTLVGVRETRCCAFPKEPTEDCRLILGIDAREGTAFRNTCLTTPYLDAFRYLQAVGKPYGIVPTAAMVRALERRIGLERQLLYVFFEVKPVLKRLSRVYRQALVTDSWPFPVGKLLGAQRFDRLFAHFVVSSVEGVCKAEGDGTAIYAIAAGKMGLPAGRLCMIGDDPYRDCVPAMRLGFKAILIDRDYEHMDPDGEWTDKALAGLRIPVIRSYEHLPAPARRHVASPAVQGRSRLYDEQRAVSAAAHV